MSNLSRKGTSDSCDAIRQHEKMLICFTRKTSGIFWYFMDTLSYKLDKFARLYEKFIESGYNLEYLTAEISKDDRALHIGAGAYPLTGIILVRTLKVGNVLAIDNNIKAVEMARSVISKKKLDGSLFVRHADGLGFDVGDFNVIIISSSSWPHIEILKHVFKTSKSETKIIVRTLDFAIIPITECIKSHKNIRIIKKINNHSFPFYSPFGWQTFYLQKK